jgi:hypothetical protein
MSVQKFLADLKSMGPLELVAFLLLVCFGILLLLGATIEAGPLVSLVKWADIEQANLNQKFFGSPRYYKKATVFGFLLIAAIPYYAVHFLERRISRPSDQNRK